MTSPAIPVERIDLGISDGLHRWEVRNADTGEIVGYDDESTDPLTPDPVDPATLIAAVNVMTDDQKADLRAALGL